MRIFSAVRHSADPGRYYGSLWSGNFYPALRELGHDIVESQTDLLPTSLFMDISEDFTPQELEARAQTTERILNEVRAAHSRAPIDLFLSYFYNSHFDPAGFDELRRIGIPSVNFYCNSIYQFELVQAVAAKADYAWHAEKDARQYYLNVGARPVWVQMAADPKMYPPGFGVSRSPKACFVGQRYADRDRWLAALIGAGIPVEVYGPGWGVDAPPAVVPAAQPESAASGFLGRLKPAPGSWQSYLQAMRWNVKRGGLVNGVLRTARQSRYKKESGALIAMIRPGARGPVPPSEISSIFAQHEVCLNFSNVWADGRPGSRLIPHVRLRDFEGPMSRTCYLTGYTEEITHFYDVGSEIDTYRSQAELVDKIRFYLQHPDAAEKLRDAGYRRASSSHTWRNRFEELFQKIGLARNLKTAY